MSDHTSNTGVSESVEPEGLDSTKLIVLMVGAFVMFMIVAIGVQQVTDILFQDARLSAGEVTGYPLLTETRDAGESLLTSYAPVDRGAGIYRIPIGEAMQLVVEDYQELSSN